MSRTRIVRRRVDRSMAITVAAVGVVVPAACGGDSSEMSTPVADTVDAATTDDGAGADAPAFGLVSPGEAAVIATDPAVTVIDVRTPEEFDDGHLEGADLIDFYEDTFADQLAELDPDGTYLVYCRSGNRSGQSTAMMAELGFDRVYDLDGGVIAWAGQGQPLVR